MPSSSPAGAPIPSAAGRSSLLYAGTLLIVAGLVYAGWGKLRSEWMNAPILLLAPAAYLLLILMAPELFARRCDPVRLDRHWENWLRITGCMALVVLGMLGVTMGGSPREIIVGILYGLGGVYAAATAIIILRRNFGPMAHAYSGPVMRESAAGVPAWFRPLYVLGWPARFLARKLFPEISLGLGSILTLSSLLLVTSGYFGCSDRWYRGYHLLALRGHWITAENLSAGLSQRVSNGAALVAYAAGLLAAVLAWVLLARGGRTLARLTLALAAMAAFFVVADCFAGIYSEPNFPAVLPVVTFCYVAFAGALLLSSSRATSPPERDLWTLRLAALMVPPLLLSYGLLILIAGLPGRVWGFIAYFFGVQLLWWGALQTKRSLQR